MKKATLLLILCVLASLKATCQVNCTPVNSCDEAPLLCGFELINNVFSNDVPEGGGLSTSCAIAPHNSVWLRFIPCDPDLNITVNAISSQTGDGLQLALFEDCMSNTEISCNVGQDNGAFIPLPLVTTVTPGKTYYLMIDGYLADICDFQIDVVSGIDTVPPVIPPGGPYAGIITGPTSNPCSGLGVGTYTVTWPGCSQWSNPAFACIDESCVCIEWEIPPGAFILGDPCSTTVEIDFSGTPPGSYLITASPKCLCAENLCENCGPICCPVNPASLVVFIQVPFLVTLPEIKICYEADFPYCVYEPGGFVSFNYAYCQTSDPANCQFIRQPYRRQPTIMANAGELTFCDTIWICNYPYTQSGTFVEYCTTPQGCDSMVVFTLKKDPNCFFNCISLNDPAPPGDSCQTSPFFCGNYLENYCGSNTGLTDDTLGNMLLQNTGFIRVQPCSDSVVLHVGVSNCAPGGVGLSFGLFEGDCPSNGLISLDTVNEDDFYSLIFNNLSPDSVYSLVISGVNDSECEFNIHVVEGIGTAEPGPINCTCVDGFIDGPDRVCPGDIATYSIVPPACTSTGGDPVGGNGYLCTPPNSCPPGDSLKLVWHIPDGMHFIGDSTGTIIQITLNDDYFFLDTFRIDSIWISWEFVVPAPAVDSLLFCACNGVGCAGSISIKQIEIFHEILYESCQLTCVSSQCYVAGEIFTQPGQYLVEIDHCTHVIVTVWQDIVPPWPPIVPPQTICEGEATTLAVLNFPPQNYFSWSTGAFGPSITVSPSITTSYGVTVTDSQNGCTNDAQTLVTVLPNDFVDFGEVGVITCSQPCVEFQGLTYCQPGQYSIQTGICSSFEFSIGADPAIPTQSLPPVTICAGDCFDFYGQPICSDSTAMHIENCTLYVQQIIVAPQLVSNSGVVGHVNCTQSCIDYKGLTYCTPGIYSIPTGQCSMEVFEIIFEKETQQLGEVGIITCAENCVSFEGQNYCQPGTYMVEDSCYIKHFSIGQDLSLPVCSLPAHNCLPSNTQFTVAFSITGQQPFKVNSVEISGSNFLSAPIPNGTQYAFIVEQSNGCQAIVNGSFDCSMMCATDAGGLSSEMLHGCAGQSTLQAQPLNSPVSTAGDVIEYWLKNASGNVIGQNTSGAFTFLPGIMVSDETYFIQRVVGPPDLNGHPDLSSVCTDTTNTQPLIFHSLPPVQVIGETSICGGNTLTLSASGATAYLWPDGSTTNVWSVETPVALQEITYSLSGTDTWGCTNSASIAVSIMEVPVLAEVLVHHPECLNDENGSIEIKLTNGGIAPLTFALNDGDFGSSLLFSGLASGTYSIAVQDAFGCVSDSGFVLTSPLPPTLSIGPDIQINIGDAVKLSAEASHVPASIIWESDNGLTQNGGLEWDLQPLQSMIVQCEMVDSNGCKARDEAVILVEIHDGIYRPNVLMQSANQVDNQYFTLYAAEGWIRNIVSLSIYDRWGEMVWQNVDFQPNIPSLGWDGHNKNGAKVNPDVFVYLTVIELVNGDRLTLKGDVTLVR